MIPEHSKNVLHRFDFYVANVGLKSPIGSDKFSHVTRSRKDLAFWIRGPSRSLSKLIQIESYSDLTLRIFLKTCSLQDEERGVIRGTFVSLYKSLIFLPMALVLSGCGSLSGEVSSLFEEILPSTWSTKISAPTAIYSVMEGGTVGLLLTLKDAAQSDTSFRWSVSPIDNRFMAFSGFGKVLAGQENFSFQVQTINDSLFQGSSSYTLNIWGENFENEVSIQLNVIDDESSIGLSLADSSINESAGNLSLVFTLSNVATENLTFDYTTSDGTATQGTDYVATSGSVTIPVGQTQAIKTLSILSDSLFEDDESILIRITNASSNVAVLTSVATVTILNDDLPPTLAVNDVAALENSGHMDFTVSLSQASGKDTLVNYLVSGVTALIGVDFGVTLGTLTIPAGQLSGTISVPINDDVIYEGPETLTIDLSSPTNGTISDGQGVGTITDDNNPPTLSIANGSVNEDTGTLVFMVTKTGSTVFPATVDYATSNGTATAGSDYTSTSGTLTFSAGESTGIISVSITSDNTLELDETLIITLSNPTGATISGSSATGTITNDDGPTISGVSPPSGSDIGGVTITLTGAGFLSGATATVGGATCTSPTVVSSTIFTCVTPSTATSGAVDIVLTNTIGSQPTGPRSATYTNGYTHLASSWNFGVPGDFTYDSSLFTTSQALNKATLTPPDLTHDTQAEFDAGAHVGTVYSGGVLKLDATLGAQTELSSSWTPRWSKIGGYWKMDNNWIDSSSSGSNGTTTGSPTFSIDRRVGSFSGNFDGVDDEVNFGGSSSLKPSYITWSVWLKYASDPANPGNAYGIFALTDGPGSYQTFYIFDGGSCRVTMTGSTSHHTHCPNQALTVGAWNHLVGTYDGTATKLYVNGALVISDPFAGGPLQYSNSWSSDLIIGRRWADYFPGQMDDFAIWSEPLSADEISLIYNRQKQKYSGIYLSSVTNVPSASSIFISSWLSSLPFLKELPGDIDSNGTPDNEPSAEYSSLLTNLSSGLIAYWKFNEHSLGLAPGGKDLVDHSGSSFHGTQNNNPEISKDGLFNKSHKFNGTNTYYTVAHNPALIPANFTISSWVKIAGDTHSMIVNNQNGTYYFKIGSTNLACIYVNGVAAAWNCGTTTLSKDKWYYVTATYDGVSSRVYVNGNLENTFTGTGGPTYDPSKDIEIGRRLGTTIPTEDTEYFSGYIDELSMWNRPLTDTEIIQLYRRGANRNKFQFRTCTQSDCSDKTDAEWVGPNKTASTWFSDLHNMASVAASGDGSGTINLSSPILDFTKWITAVAGWTFNPTPAQYFQYRALMESDDENNLCGGSPCMPDIQSVASVPAVAITTTVGRAFPSALTQFNVTKAGDCGIADDVRFLVSSDNGSTYKYWNGSAWTSATTTGSYAQATAYTATNSNIGTLASSGTFKFKALVPSQYGKTCELSLPSIRW